MNEKLLQGERIIRICPTTKQVVLCEYEGNDNVLDLHNETIAEDIQDVINFLKPYLK